MQTEWQGKWALVTGASAGIGLELATQLAAGGTHLVLTARRRDRLEALAAKLTASHKIQVEIFVADLTHTDAPEKIHAFTKDKGLAIDLLINNAGFGQYGELPQVAAQRLLDMVQVNCAAVVYLTRLYLPDMIARGHGDVLILASTASFQAVPYISTYAATKAFDLLFADGEDLRALPGAIGKFPLTAISAKNSIAVGMDFSGTNTAREGYELVPLQAGDVTTVDFYLDLPELYPASFSFSPAIADGTLMGYQMCDWIDNAITLQMGRSEAPVYGYLHLPCRVEVNARIRTERQLESHLG